MPRWRCESHPAEFHVALAGNHRFLIGFTNKQRTGSKSFSQLLSFRGVDVLDSAWYPETSQGYRKPPPEQHCQHSLETFTPSNFQHGVIDPRLTQSCGCVKLAASPPHGGLHVFRFHHETRSSNEGPRQGKSSRRQIMSPRKAFKIG